MVKVRELEWRGAGDRIEAWFNNPGTARPVHCIPAKETDTDLVLAQGIKEAADRIDALEKALRFYADNAAKCRLLHREGDVGRQALNDDGGFIARAALGEGE